MDKRKSPIYFEVHSKNILFLVRSWNIFMWISPLNNLLTIDVYLYRYIHTYMYGCVTFQCYSTSNLTLNSGNTKLFERSYLRFAIIAWNN